LLVFWHNPGARKALGATFLACVALLATPDHRHAKTYWSPCQKLVVRPTSSNGQVEAYSLTTNDALYQTILNLSPAFVQSHPEQFLHHPVEWNAYNLPYRCYPSPPSVLVLGSGMENDVAAALRNGAGRAAFQCFSRASFRGSALGSNLFGSLLGGLLESSSLWFGLRSLTILAAILYVGPAIFLRRDPISHSDVS
jgi:hypothetical protein